MRKEEKLKETVNKVIGNISKKLDNKNKVIIGLWKNNINEEIKRNTSIDIVKDKILYIKAKTPAWIYEVKNKKKKIIDIINNEAKEEVLKDIKVKLGDI